MPRGIDSLRLRLNSALLLTWKRIVAAIWLHGPVCSSPSTPIETLVRGHFALFSSTDHPCKKGLLVGLTCLGSKPAKILETGSSAWGTDSTRLFAKYVGAYGGEFWSVDLRGEPANELGRLGRRVDLVVGDSVTFIQDLRSSQPDLELYFIYLDSYDVDWLNCSGAAIHGFAEWEAILPLTKSGTVVVVDDTPASASHANWLSTHEKAAISDYLEVNDLPPGKGSLIYKYVREKKDWEVLLHEYNLGLRRL